MASFTDLIPQFNPYIQQLPVEAMVSVGMEKQKRYDEGIQKLQAQIDQIAGINVLRPVDKAYLQSKLNELGNNLKGVAAGDFSNFQLVNSVGGMIGQMSKDPYVMAAVRSTAQDQKNAEFMESERKAGKLDPANAYVYGLQRNKYLNSGLKDTEGRPVVFSGQYEPYRNVYEKLSKIAKDVGVDERIVQNLFNPDGTVNKVMIETVSKGKDANKIYDAFVNGLDSGDYRQLEINGIYKYKDRSAADMVNTLDTSNKQYVQTALDKKADVEDEIANLRTKLASAKPVEAKDISSKIVSLQSLIKNIDENVKSSEENFATSRERILSGDDDYVNAVKGKVHTNNFLTSLSKDFSESISHVKYAENPLWKAIMEEKKFALDSWYKKESVKAAKRANELKELELFPLVQATGVLPGDQVSLAETINQQYVDKIGERDQKLINLAKWDMKRLGWSDDKISEWVKTQAKNRGQSEADVMATWGTTTLTKIKAGTITPSSEIASEVDNINGLNNFVAGFQKLIQSSDERAKAEGGESVKGVPDIIKETKPLTVYVGGDYTARTGKPVVLSGQDQLDLARFVAWRREIFSTKVEDKEREAAIKRFENKYGPMSRQLEAWAESQYASSPGGIRRAFGAERSPFQEVINKYTGNAYESFKQSQEKVYRETFSALYPKNETFVLTDKSRPILQANMSALFIDRPEFADIKEKLDDPKSQVVVTTAPSISGLGGESQLSMRVIGDKGVTTEPLQISLEQYQTLFRKQPDQVDPNIALTRAIVNGSPDGSSNSKGLGSIPTSYFGRNAFKYMTPQYNILGGDFVRDASGADIYYPKVYYIPRGSNDPVPVDIGLPMSITDAMSFPLMMDDNKFKQIINKK